MRMGRNLMIEETLDGTFTVWNGYSYHILTNIPKEVIIEFVEKIYKIADRADGLTTREKILELAAKIDPIWKAAEVELNNKEDMEDKK